MASFEDRYELLEVWGRGAHGTVWKARERATGRIVAIKRVPRDPREKAEDWEERLRREAELLARVRHPGIVEVIEVGFHLDEAFLVTEFVEGGSLEDLLRARGRLAPLEAAALVAWAARALHAAHRAGVVHRDVKPGNVLLGPDGTIKVTDFGVAGTAGERASAGEAPGVVVGTPAYTAPEQLRGEPVDGRADVWSLGVVLWRCLAGAPPFQGDSVAEIAHRVTREALPDPEKALPGAPAELRELLARVLRKDPAERPASALDLARALEAAIVAAGEADEVPVEGHGREAPVGGSPAAPTVGPRVEGRQVRPWATVAGAVVVASLVVGVVLLQGTRPGIGTAGDGNPGMRGGVVARRALVRACAVEGGKRCAPALASALAEDPGDDEVFGALGRALTGEDGAWTGRAGDGTAPEPRERTRTDGRKQKQKRTTRSPARRRAHPPRRSLPRGAVASRRPRDRREATRAAGSAEAEERPAPRPAALRDPAVEPAAVPARGRGVVEVRHGLSEGLVELLVDGRRAGLVRVGPGTAFPAGTPVTVSFSVAPGEHRLVLRVLSATERVELERRWTARWSPDEFRAMRWGVVGSGEGGWDLQRMP